MVPSSLTWVRRMSAGPGFSALGPGRGPSPGVALGWDTVRTVLGPKDTLVGAAVATCQPKRAMWPSTQVE